MWVSLFMGISGLIGFNAQADVNIETDDSATEPLLVTIDEGSGIPGAAYSGKYMKGGITIGFNFNLNSREVFDAPNNRYKTEYYLENVTVYGATASDPEVEEVKVPRYLEFQSDGHSYIGEVSSTSFEFSYGADKSFTGMPNLKDIYLPSTINYVGCSGDDIIGFMNLHLRSEEVPTFEFSNQADQKMKIYIIDNFYDKYDKALSPYNYFVCNESPAAPVRINIVSPGTLAEEIYQYLENLSQVRWLILTGSPNEEDMLVIRRMEHLETLDLSGAKITKLEKCHGLKYLENIYLPEGLKELGQDAFASSPSLQKIILPSTVVKIANAFENCTNLYDVTLSGSLKIIGRKAFCGCGSLTSLDIPEGVEQIGEFKVNENGDYYDDEQGEVFVGTNLKKLRLPSSLWLIADMSFMYVPLEEINLENVRYIGYRVFDETQLKKINLQNLEHLGHLAFYYCHSLQEVKFGEKLKSIASSSFDSCDIRELTIPDNIEDIYHSFYYNNNLKKITLGKNLKIIEGAFYGCKPDTVIAKMLFPLDRNGFDGRENISDAKLFVPALSINAYLMHDAWYNFREIQPLPDSDMTDVTFDRPFSLRTNQGLAEKANIINLSALTIGRKAPLDLNSFEMQSSNNSGNWWDWGAGQRNGYATLIIETLHDDAGKEIGTEVSADNVKLTVRMSTNSWHFLTFPFDINVKDIKVNDDALWVVRRYSGENRAALTGDTWLNMTDNDVLKMGEGYIFHCYRENESYVDFSFIPTAATRNNLFRHHDYTKQLESYPSQFAHNDSWNLVGNTYPAYVNIRGIEFEAPITIWSGDNYWAYSPIDDELILSPYQGFFVQRQKWEGGDKLTIKAESRAHSEEDANNMYEATDDDVNGRMRSRSTYEGQRALFDLTLSDNNSKDRVRAIVNEEASMDYETNRDASKFMSTTAEIPQIYILNNDIKMAIDERPLGNGDFILGTRIGKEGFYKFSLNSRNAEGFKATLMDLKTSVATDLSVSDYEFKGNEGTDDNRFILTIRRVNTTTVEGIAEEDINIRMEGKELIINSPEAIAIQVFTTDGKTILNCEDYSLSMELPEGLYIVKAGNKVVKVLSGK